MRSTDSRTFPPSFYSLFAWSVHATPFHSGLHSKAYALASLPKFARRTKIHIYIDVCLLACQVRACARQANTFLSCQATTRRLPLQKMSLAGIRYIATMLSVFLKSVEEEMGSLTSVQQSRRKARFPLLVSLSLGG